MTEFFKNGRKKSRNAFTNANKSIPIWGESKYKSG